MPSFVPKCIPVLLAVLTSVAALASPTGPTPYPSSPSAWPGEGAIRVFGWMTQDRARFWKEREDKQGAVVLAGDSLLGGWKRAEQDLRPLRVANRAIGGDTSRGLLYRFQEDVLALNPSRIVMLIGGNDLSAHQDPAQTARNIERMLDAAVAAKPGLPVVLCTLTPRDHPEAPVKPGALDALNGHVRRIAKARSNVELVDLYPLFLAPGGGPDPQYFGKDRLHLSGRGYERLHEVLGPVLSAR